MSATRERLALRPELCDRCGSCVRACSAGHLRVGAGYIYVDVTVCDGCLSCADACPRGAISRSSSANRGSGLAVEAGASGGKVVVRSRAEAKALRRSAEDARPQKRVRESVSSGPVVWTLIDALAVGAVLLASLVAKNALLGSQAVEVMPADARIVVRSLLMGAAHLAVIGVSALLARRHGVGLASAFRLVRVKGEAAGVASAAMLVLALLVGTRVAATAWGAISQAVGWMPPPSDTLVGVFGSGGMGLALALVTVVLIGPFAEELAFRGVIAGALGGRFGTRVGIVGSAAIFSLYHVTPWVMVPTFVLGLALGWLASTRRTLWPAIALHALYNAVVVAAVFWMPAS